MPTSRGRNQLDAASGVIPAAREHEAEAGGVRAEPHIEGQLHRRADADGDPVAGTDQRLLRVEQPQRQPPAPVANAFVRQVLDRVGIGEDMSAALRCQVRARAEGPIAMPGDDHRAHGVVGIGYV